MEKIHATIKSASQRPITSLTATPPFQTVPIVAICFLSSTMKFVATVFALALTQAAAFQVVPRQANSATQLFAEYEPMEGEGKINLKIDLDSPKVATMVRELRDCKK